MTSMALLWRPSWMLSGGLRTPDNSRRQAPAPSSAGDSLHRLVARGATGAELDRCYPNRSSDQLKYQPPFTLMVCPVIYPLVASSTATEATSSTVPKRPTGM